MKMWHTHTHKRAERCIAHVHTPIHDLGSVDPGQERLRLQPQCLRMITIISLSHGRCQDVSTQLHHEFTDCCECKSPVRLHPNLLPTLVSEPRGWGRCSCPTSGSAPRRYILCPAVRVCIGHVFLHFKVKISIWAMCLSQGIEVWVPINEISLPHSHACSSPFCPWWVLHS